MYRFLVEAHVVHQFSSYSRVKELGPGGPVEGKPAEIEQFENQAHGAMSPQNTDLHMLRNDNVSIRGKM